MYTLKGGSMNYYKDIKNELLNNEVCKKVKNYAINRSDLQAYYNVGKLLSKAGKHYGQGIIKEYSIRLTNELGKGYSKRNLWLMLRFYEVKEKMQTVSAQYKEVLYNLDDSIIYRADYDGSVMLQLKKDKLKINTCTS